MVRSSFQNLCFRNRFVTEILENGYGMSRELRVGCFVSYLQKLDFFGLSPDYF